MSTEPVKPSAEVVRDMYEKVEPPSPMRACACCGAKAELWKYRANPDSLAYIPGCSKVEGFGYEGKHECPMYELSHLERSTKKEAVRDWNAFNDNLFAARDSSAPAQQGEHEGYVVPEELMRILWNTCDFYANHCSYEPERIGGVLQGCPRGPQPTIDEMASNARMAMNALHRWKGYTPIWDEQPKAQPSSAEAVAWYGDAK